MSANVLQVLPRAPGTFDGVGDYALNLACGLRDQHEIDSVFLAHEATPKREIQSFRTFPLAESSHVRASIKTCDGIIIHYVNYGFQKRGVPVTLVSFLKSLHRECGGALLVIFHELFASGPPWRSEFWLRPLQKKITRSLALSADARLVSCESMRRQLEKLCPDLRAIVQPVTSTWGEPKLDHAQLRSRDPHSWIICGGTALVERSLRSFLQIVDSIPLEIAPRKLRVIGGAENPAVQQMLSLPAKFTAEYFPSTEPETASSIFCASAFAWMDYFSSSHVPADVLLKSSTFVGLCAHGVTTVLPSVSGAIAIGSDALPGPFPVSKMPAPSERADAAVAGYEWYHRHASAAVLTSAVAQQLQLA